LRRDFRCRKLAGMAEQEFQDLPLPV